MKRDWTSRTAILLVGLILLVVNLIGVNLFARADLTDDNVYSLSDASIDLVESLKDPITITAFFSSGLPAPYSTNRRFLKDKLDDYRAYGGGNVQYRFVDPSESDDVRSDAQRFGIPPVQIQVIESDNVQLKNAYMGVAVEYGGDRETIPVVKDLSTLEYDLTSAIRRLTRDQLPVVGFLSGHGEPNPMQNMQTLHQELSRNYDVKTVSINGEALTPRPDALIIDAPTDSLPPEHLRAIDQYLSSGGRVAVLLNRVSANLQQGQATQQDVGMQHLLAAYGAGVSADLIMDRQSSVVTMQRRQGIFNVSQQIEYPFFPIATHFADDNMMVNRLGQVMFYFVSSVDTSVAMPEGVTMEPLIFSSNQSRSQREFFMIQPQFASQVSLDQGPYILGAAYTGTFPSAYGAAPADAAPGRLVVVGDGDFLNESIVGRIPGNIELGLNMVDWLVQDQALLAIRAKKIEPRSLEDVSDALQPWIKYLNMIGPVLLVVIFGLARWRRRKRREVDLSLA